MINAISAIKKKKKGIQKLREPEAKNNKTKKCKRWIIIKHYLVLQAMTVTWS